MTKFTKGGWLSSSSRNHYAIHAKNGDISTLLCDLDYCPDAEANAHLIAAAPDMYQLLERQRKGLINLIELNLIHEIQFESVKHEIFLIDNELSRARGE